MLTDHASVSGGGRARDAHAALGAYLQIDLARLLFWLRRGAKWIVLGAVVGLLLGLSYAMLAKPRYTVNTDILMNPTGLQIVSDDLFGSSEQRETQLLNVESKRQTLLSRSVLLRAIAALKLQDDPEFVPPAPAFSIRGLLGGGGGVSQSPSVTALDTLERRLTARRDEASFVVTMTVWTQDAQKSIRISEAIMRAFREELVAADTAGAKRSVEALTARIGELRNDVNAADAAVETFRREHRLQSSQGELVSSRSMTQVNQQLVEARQRLIAAESRHRQLSSPNAADVAAMLSNTIPTLRAQYASLKSEVASLSRIYGARHPRLARQNSALATLQAEIDAETRRVVLAARNELEQAKAVVAALEAEAMSAGSDVFADNDAEIRLRELTREASAKAAIYEAFLARAHQIAERQQLDTTNIRVISAPVLPKSRSWPPSTSQVGGFGAMAGMVLSVMAVLGFGIATDMKTAPVRLLPSPPEDGADRARPADPVPSRDPEPAAPAMAGAARSGSLLTLARDLRRAAEQTESRVT